VNPIHQTAQQAGGEAVSSRTGRGVEEARPADPALDTHSASASPRSTRRSLRGRRRRGGADR
jgi:hypothetical protein